MVQVDHYDAVIIGAGQAGVPLGIALAQAGGRTALIEREHVGGTCVNEGCTPSKTMVASARVVYLARRGPHYGIETDPMAEVDMVTVRGRKRAIVERFRSSSEHRLAQCPGLDLFRGEASFTGPRSLVVQLSSGQRQEIAAETIFINTGQRPTMPLLMGLDGVPALTSTTIMALDAVPEHLLILGGGYVGVEFSQMFRRFGSEVTIVQRGAQLLAREDPDVAAAVTEILREDGIEVLLDSTAVHVEGMADERVWLHLRTPQDERTLLGSHLLVATGRTPNTEALNLWLAGVATDARGYVRVNERLETTAPGIYALGDVTGEPAFTHVSYDDYRIIRANLLEGGNRTTRERLVPYTVFIDPELGRVGLSEQEARNQGRAIRVARMPMSAVARALEVDEPRGLIKAVVDADSGQILGCAVLGLEGGEILALLQVAMLGRLPYTPLRDGIFTHPTLAEALNTLFAHLDG